MDKRNKTLLTVIVAAIILALGFLAAQFFGAAVTPPPVMEVASVDGDLQQDENWTGVIDFDPDPESASESDSSPELSDDLKALEKENLRRLSQGCLTGKDCIQSIDNPKFVSALEAERDFLSGEDWVIGLYRNDEARAYPLKILNWHEIVNDKIGEEYIAVSFCPLCFTGNAFERIIEGEPSEFGVSGYLLNSNLVMYDRATDSLWEQLTGEALSGPQIGNKLKKITVSTLPWSDWKLQHPESKVLSTDTGFSRDYQLFPYGDYNTSERVLFSLEHEDDRLFEKELTYGVLVNDKSKAYPLSALEANFPEGGEFEDSVGGHPVKVTWQDGSFQVENTVTEEEVVPEIGFWFSWVAFYPDTEVYAVEEEA